MKSALLTVAMSIIVAADTSAASPQRYPTKPIRLVVGSAPGSGPDIMARLRITPALADTIAGQVQFTIAVIPAVLPMIKTGKLKALGVTSLRRTPLVADLPTIAESVPGYEVIGWYSLVVPASTPNPIISRLNAEAVRALRTPELQERISSLGAEPIGSTPEQLALHLRTQLEKLQKAVKAAGLRRE